MAGRPRTQARLARLGLADDGGRAHARTYRVCCAYLHRHLHACLRLLDGCHLCRCRPWFRHGALVGITGKLFLSWSLLLSQAMESVTRAFYSRSDLDLILTSPASARKVFAVRMGRIAMAAVAIAVLLAAPFINVLAALGGGRWLAAYGVVIAMGAVATATSSPTSAGGRPCCGETRVPQAGVRLAPMLWQAAAVLTTQTGVGLPCLLHCAKMRVEPT